MNSFWLKILAVCMAIGFFAGCHTHTTQSGVTVTVTSLKMLPNAPGGPKAELNLDYVNETIVDFAVSRTEHKVYLNGMFAGIARSQTPLGLRQFHRASQTVTMNVDKEAVTHGVLTISGQVSYRMDTVLYVEAGEERIEMKSRSEGEVAVPGGPTQ